MAFLFSCNIWLVFQFKPPKKKNNMFFMAPLAMAQCQMEIFSMFHVCFLLAFVDVGRYVNVNFGYKKTIVYMQ